MDGLAVGSSLGGTCSSLNDGLVAGMRAGLFDFKAASLVLWWSCKLYTNLCENFPDETPEVLCALGAACWNGEPCP